MHKNKDPSVIRIKKIFFLNFQFTESWLVEYYYAAYSALYSFQTIMIILSEFFILRNHHLAYLVCLNQQHFVTGRKHQMFHRLFNLKKILYIVIWILNNKRIHKAILETKDNEINAENQSQSMHSILCDYHLLLFFKSSSTFTWSRMPCLLIFI